MKLLQTVSVLVTLATTAFAQFGGFGGGGFGGGGFGGGGFGGGFGGAGDAGGGAASVPALKEGPPATTNTIKIMPVGDSITFGMGENGGYRKYLYSALTTKGYKIDMVGPEGSPSATAAGIQYDDQHAGYSGFQIKEIPDWGRQQGGDGSLYNKLKDKNAVKQAQPDIILLLIGTNDMTANRSMDACAADLRALLDYMIGDMPADCMIFMGSIPEFTAYGGNAQRVANYNGTVKKVADEYESKGKNVRFADVHGSLNGTNDLGGDQLHPNGNGYKKMGAFWAQTVDDYLQEKFGAATPSAPTTLAPAIPVTPTPAIPVTPTPVTPVTPPVSNLSDCSAKITSQGYKCCSKNCVVYYTDSDGTWGVENNEWCGCAAAAAATCVGAQGYPCCKTATAVAFVDSDGNWGVENGNWCLIKA